MSDGEEMETTANQRAREVAAEAQEDAETETVPGQTTLADLRVAIVAGITQEGNFVFDLVAKNPEDKNLLSLLALGYYVGNQVDKTWQQTQQSGDALTAALGQGLNLMNQKLDALLAQSKNPGIRL